MHSVYVVVAVNNIPDAFHAEVEESTSGSRSPAKPPPNDKTSMKCDGETTMNVRWTAVDKDHLVELVDHMATVGDFHSQLQDDQFHCQPSVTADSEPTERRCGQEAASENVNEICLHSASEESFEENVFRQDADCEPTQIDDQQRAFVHGEVTPVTSDRGEHQVTGLSRIISSSPGVAQNRDSKRHCYRKLAVRKTNSLVSRMLGSSGKVPENVERGSPEVWTSVDKSLVEDLFDQLLRSFDDIKVSKPETDENGSDESRGLPSANQRPSAVDLDVVTNDPNDVGLRNSAAYKWKSHLLQRMCIQQSTTRDLTLCRKRRHADRKLVQIT